MWPDYAKMADEQNMEDDSHETASLSDNQPILLANETSNMKQEVSSPIPGFPPLFQFAKLQTEASLWTSNASASSSNCDEFVDQTPTVIKTELSSDPPGSSQGSDASNSRSVNGVEMSCMGENSGLGIVMKLHEEELEEAVNVEEKAEERDEEDVAGNDEPDEEEAESDPYFYTKRDEFTSEIYKIELQNLPKKCGYKVSSVANLLT